FLINWFAPHLSNALALHFYMQLQNNQEIHFLLLFSVILVLLNRCWFFHKNICTSPHFYSYALPLVLCHYSSSLPFLFHWLLFAPYILLHPQLHPTQLHFLEQLKFPYNQPHVNLAKHFYSFLWHLQFHLLFDFALLLSLDKLLHSYWIKILLQ